MKSHFLKCLFFVWNSELKLKRGERKGGGKNPPKDAVVCFFCGTMPVCICKLIFSPTVVLLFMLWLSLYLFN